MVKKKQRKTSTSSEAETQRKVKRPRANAAVHKSGNAGKCKPRTGKTAAQNAPSAKPVTQRGQKSRSTTAANDRSRKAALQEDKTSTDEMKGLFKFRRYKRLEGGKNKKKKHPKLIVEQEKNTVGFMGLTEESKSGHHKNIELKENPKTGDSRKAYIRKELRHDTIDNFGEILDKYHLSETDKKEIIKFIEKRKKKK